MTETMSGHFQATLPGVELTPQPESSLQDFLSKFDKLSEKLKESGLKCDACGSYFGTHDTGDAWDGHMTLDQDMHDKPPMLFKELPVHVCVCYRCHLELAFYSFETGLRKFYEARDAHRGRDLSPEELETLLACTL